MANYILLMLKADPVSLGVLERLEGAGAILDSLADQCESFPPTANVALNSALRFPDFENAGTPRHVSFPGNGSPDLGYLAGYYYDGRTIRIEVPAGYLACTFCRDSSGQLRERTGRSLKDTITNFTLGGNESGACKLFNRLTCPRQTLDSVFQPLFLNGMDSPQPLEIHKTHCRRPDDTMSRWVYDAFSSYTSLEPTV